MEYRADIMERNYLRMRGEYGFVVHAVFEISELPPHARRILGYVLFLPVVDGTTSACAENTELHLGEDATTGNYLRMRGEYCG